jgi:hypothetical protein
MASPIPGKPITFGYHAKKSNGDLHEGVDYGDTVPVGTHVFSVADGVVSAVGNPWGLAYGQHSVVIKHFLEGKSVWAIYAHCSKYLVRAGQIVKLGQLIALSGNEGNVTGAHLHFGLMPHSFWVKGAEINPQALLDVKEHKMQNFHIVLANDQISADEIRKVSSVVKLFIADVCKTWSKPTMSVSYGLKRAKDTPTIPADSWDIIIGDENMNTIAYAYHTVENGLPVAYCSPTMSGLTKEYRAYHEAEMWGTIIPARKVIKIGNTIILPAKSATYNSGFITEVLHEIAEMIIDPQLNSWAIEANGDQWLN